MKITRSIPGSFVDWVFSERIASAYQAFACRLDIFLWSNSWSCDVLQGLLSVSSSVSEDTPYFHPIDVLFMYCFTGFNPQSVALIFRFSIVIRVFVKHMIGVPNLV